MCATSIEISKSHWRCVKIPWPSQEVEASVCFVGCCINVVRPGQVVGDIYLKKPIALGHLLLSIDGTDWDVCSTPFPEVNNQLPCFTDIEEEVVGILLFLESFATWPTVVSEQNVATQSRVQREYRKRLRPQPCGTPVSSMLCRKISGENPRDRIYSLLM